MNDMVSRNMRKLTHIWCRFEGAKSQTNKCVASSFKWKALFHLYNNRKQSNRVAAGNHCFTFVGSKNICKAGKSKVFYIVESKKKNVARNKAR